jgi:2-isopropylmalate synthase
MVLGRHSGTPRFCGPLAVSLALISATRNIQAAYERFLSIADKKKEIFDEDIAAIINDEVRTVEQTYSWSILTSPAGPARFRPERFASVCVTARRFRRPPAVTVRFDAAYEAIRQATGQSPTLENYNIRAVTGGKEAIGEATVRIKNKAGKSFIGRGASTDIIEASAKAYVDAINRMVACTGKCEGEKVSL